MMRYILIKLLRALACLLAVIFFTFTILNLAGDPATVILSPDAPPEVIAAFRKSWGLDQPIWLQFVQYCINVLHGDFGRSMRGGQQALEMVMDRLPATLALTIPALILKVVLGISAGIFAALNRGSLADRLTVTLAVAGHTVPNFVLGFLLVLVFAVGLHWLPSGGFSGLPDLVLPVVTLALSGAAIIARFTRSAMIDVLGQPYVRAARAKGLPWIEVVIRHALPNAAIPTVTVIGLMVGSIVAGAVVVESVFSWPGIGRLLVVSVSSRDLPVVQAILILMASCMIAANLIVDLLYGLLDPRIRHADRLKAA